MLEPTQLMIKTNYTIQSNKDMQQKTNVLANAESKSFDQILSFFNMVKLPFGKGIQESTPSKMNSEGGEGTCENLNSLTEADWLEFDAILQELFGLYGQVQPSIQPLNHLGDQTLANSNENRERALNESIQQIIGDVQRDLQGWLQKAGDIKQLSNFDKKLLIEKIFQFANELSAIEKINQSTSINVESSQQGQFQDQKSTHNIQTSKQGLFHEQEANLFNKTAFESTKTVLKQANILDQIMKLLQLTDQDLESHQLTKTNSEDVIQTYFSKHVNSTQDISLDKSILKNVKMMTREVQSLQQANPLRMQMALSEFENFGSVKLEELHFGELEQMQLNTLSSTTSTKSDLSNLDIDGLPVNNKTDRNQTIQAGMEKVSNQNPGTAPVTNERLQVFVDSSPPENQQPFVTELFQQGNAKPILENSSNTNTQQMVLTLKNFVPEVSNWMGRFFKMTKDASGNSEAKFSLYPEHLGHLEIKIAALKGQIIAQIVTETTAAKEALDGQLAMLRQALQQQGLQVQKIEIIQQTPTAPELNQGNNATFSQGGNHQQQFSQQSEQDGSYSASKNVPHSTETEHGHNAIERDNTMPSFTYGGTEVRTASRIDFTA